MRFDSHRSRHAATRLRSSKRLTGARERRVVVLSAGSHSMGVEKNRLHLIREVQSFLDEPGS